MEYVGFCNECGSKKEIEHPKEYLFCPDCGHVNTGFSKKDNYLKNNTLENSEPK